MVIEFFMHMIPPTATHQEKKIRIVNGFPVVYDPGPVKAARAKLRDALAGYGAPDEPLAGPVRLTVKWCFPRGNHKDGAWKTTRPDTDNLQKLLKDCMTEVGFWKDDALVVSEITEKFWADIPGIWIRVEELP